MRPKPSAAAAKPKSRKPAKAPTLAQRAKEARKNAIAFMKNHARYSPYMRKEADRLNAKAIRLAVAAERERCAIIVEETAETHGSTLAGSGSSGAHIFAAAIRSGGARKGAGKT